LAETFAREIEDWNGRIIDRLPFAFASGWYFALRLKKPVDRAEDIR
jgi:hypothetical protein